MEEEDTVRQEVQINIPIPNVPLPLPSIYRVPKHIRDSLDKKYYEPKVVAIGPYHREHEHLRAMEGRKDVYRKKFLQESQPTTLECYKGKILEMEAAARACYFEKPVPELTKDEFVEMLVLDGCFILQFFIDGFEERHCDPILTVEWMLPLLHNDLLMLDNQIPFLVLKELYDMYSLDQGRGSTSQQKEPLMSMIAKYFEKALSLTITSSVDQSHEVRIDNLLHLFHCHFVTRPTPAAVERAGDAPPLDHWPTSVPCARELTLHGVTFRPMKERKNILDVTFDDGKFEIPVLRIQEPDCTRYMNLIAFEMSNHQVHKHLTSYVMLMDYLIDTADDVLILKEHNILKNQLSSAEELADFFNQLRRCSYINYNTHYLRRVYFDVDNYCKRKLHKNLASFRRSYLSTPWATFGFGFALLFGCFTIFSAVISIMQTFFHLPK